MKILLISLQITLMGFFNKAMTQELKAGSYFNWKQLPPLPGPIGFSGSFAGIANGALLVAGGSNFPDGGYPWNGSKKKWYDHIFVLEKPDGQWKEAGRLPRPLAYGVSVSWKHSVVCIGGSNESGHYADAFMLHYKKGKISVEELPPMPGALANACGAIIGDVVYIAGGTSSPDAKTTESSFWCMDLSIKPSNRKWTSLPTWPGPSRMLAVAGTVNGCFFLFSGTRLENGKREYLTDAWKYDPKKGWSQIAGLASPVVGAPSPAYNNDRGCLFIFGGDDGVLAPKAMELLDKHPGFSKTIMSYDSLKDQWTDAGKISIISKNNEQVNQQQLWAPVTTPLVVWKGAIVIPGGEVRPAIRTPKVIMACYKQDQ